MNHCNDCGSNYNNEGKVESAASGLTPAIGLYLCPRSRLLWTCSVGTETTEYVSVKMCRPLMVSYGI